MKLVLCIGSVEIGCVEIEIHIEVVVLSDLKVLQLGVT